MKTIRRLLKWTGGISFLILIGIGGGIVLLNFTSSGSEQREYRLSDGTVFVPSNKCLVDGKTDFPTNVVNAVVSAEDEGDISFHPLGIPLTSLWFAITKQKSGRGATITSQVARNFFVNFYQKAIYYQGRTIQKTIYLEWTMKKCAVLELYLQKVYFGQKAFGVSAAAKRYFGKSVAELSLPESAFLAGLIKAPSVYGRKNGGEKGLKRRDAVLGLMHKYSFITKENLISATQQPLELN